MKKITLLLLLLLSFSGYSQLTTEGFDGTTGITGPLPALWQLGATEPWAVFERNSVVTEGTDESWGINAFATGIFHSSPQSASVSREQIGIGNTSEDFLATPAIHINDTGTTELHFWTRLFTSGNQGTVFKVMFAPVAAGDQTNPDNYSPLAQWTELDLILPTSNFNVWTEKTVDLSSLAGFDVYIAFVREYTQPTDNVDGDRWFIDDVGIDRPCTVPGSLSATGMTSTSALLSWSNLAGATQWEVIATPAVGTPITYTNVTTNTNFLAGGLSPFTTYTFQVRAICDSGFSSDLSVASPSFTTLVAPPVCGGNLVDSGGPTGNYSNNENTAPLTVTPNPGDVVTVTFTAFNTQAGTDFLKIYDGPTTASPLMANLSGTVLPGSYTSTAVGGELTFVFTSNATTTAAGYAANITCGPPSACRIPTAVIPSAITTTSVTLNWTQPANADTSTASMWDIIALPCNSPAPGAGATPTANDITGPLPYILNGLTPASCYDVYIRAVCGATNSPWTPVPTQVITLVAPPVCGGNFVDSGGTTGNYSNNSTLTTAICPVNAGDAVTVTFTAFNTQAGIDLLKVYDGNGVLLPSTLIATLSGTTIPPSFTSSSSTGCLTFAFTSDGTTTAPGWVANVTCAALPVCPAPTNLTSSLVTHNSAMLDWVQPASPGGATATSWDIITLPCTAPAPTAASVPTLNDITVAAFPYHLTGLASNTCFNVYVRAQCDGATASAWTAIPTSFTTLIAPPECGGNFVDAGGIAAAYAANSNVTTIICPTNPGDVVTVTFTAFNTEANFDALYVYNGNSVVPANLIPSTNPAANVPGGLAGGYWGTTIPCPFTSAAANGCLTFVFRSDPSVQNPGWVANVTCGPPPTCATPSAASASTVTFNSAILTWTQPPNADTTVANTWDIIALPCNAPAPTAASVPTVNDLTGTGIPPYTLSGLSPATCYNVYIRAVCGAENSAWICTPIVFTTLAAPPVCGGNFVDAGGVAAAYAANSNITTTICPTNPGDVVTVTFTSFNTEANFDALYVYNGNAVVPANLIPSANPAANVPGGLAGGYWGTTLPCPFTSASADGCLTFVFRSDPSVQNPGWIANVTCGPPPTCRVPSALVATNVTHNSAILNWVQPPNADTSVASMWDIIALPCNSPAPTAGSTPTVNDLTGTGIPPYTLSGLTPATCYDIYIRAVCSSTVNSDWICTPTTITTLVAPPECGGNFVDSGGLGNYANNSNITTIICPNNPGEIVTVTFTSFFTEATWDGLYVYNGSGVVPANQIVGPNPAGNVPGNLPGSWWGNLTGANLPGPFTSTTADGCLTFVFRSDASGVNPGWVANITCSPAPTCARPVVISAQPITQTTASVSWVQPLNPDGTLANAWEYLLLPANSPVPTGPGIPVTSSPISFSGLAAGTAYIFYIRAICSPTDASTWAPYNFATLPVNDECSNATFAIVNQNLNCVQTTHGTLAGATASTPATTCGGAGAANDDVWFTFTATAATHVISFNNVTPATALSYAIYSGTCTGLTEVGCNTGANLIAGTTYYIRVFSTGTGTVFTNFDLCIGTLPCTEAPAFCTGQTVTYANATDVPSLGTIGCLGTSPNPAFFFLQVNQAGPLSYLISQVDNGGTPRDVDYVAWGPFTDLNTACSGVPANPLTQTVPIPTPATGCPGTLHACSYSIAPQEIMCIPNAQLCQVYVIMITNFSNLAGTVTFTQTNTGGGTTECFPINTFNYPQTYYCQNQPNPTPVLAPGASAGTYTSTPGLVIDSATGTIDLLASTPGAYVITSTTQTSTGGVCTNIPSITTTRTVIITAPADATIAYAAPTYCNSISAAQPVTLTGTLGGTFSASPSGLLINAITGEIIPVASTPGVYTITYTIPAAGGCPEFTTTATVEILASPVLTQSSVAACDTFTLPALTVGDYYTLPGGAAGGGTLITDLVITTTQPVSIYAEAANGCVTERTFTVTINTVPTPTFTVTQSSCTLPTGTITVTAPVSPGNAAPANIFISEVTDADTGSLSYVELFNATGAAVNLNAYKLKFYTWGAPPTAENLQCDLTLSGIMANNTTNVIKVSNNANITGITPNQTFTGCAGVNNNDNIRLTTVADVLVDQWGPNDGSIFTPGGQTGYTYRRLNTSPVPSTAWNAAEWTAIDPEDYTDIGTYSYTVSTFEYSIDNGVTFQTNPLFTGVAPGPYTLVVRDVTTGCLSEPVDVIIDAVNAIPSETTFTYVTPICQNATTNPLPDTSIPGFTTGGTFTSVPSTGIALDPATGEITLAGTTAGTYDITYTIPFDPVTCQSFSSTTFTVVISNVITPVVVFSYTTPICQDAQATLVPTLAAGFTTGGVFTSTAGLTINSSTGVIDLTTSTAGSYTITYTIAGTSCVPASVGTFDIVINSVITPVTTITYPTPVCLSSTTNPMPNTSATGFTAGGTYTSNPSAGIVIDPNTGEINLAGGTTAGTYVITYTVAANAATCQSLSSTDFTVVITNTINPGVGFSYTTPICKNAQATLSPTLAAGFTSGGTFSSTTGLSINASTGVIDLANSTAGSYTVTYAVAANPATCLVADSGTFNIVINPVITPVTSFSYDTPFCSSGTGGSELPNLGTGFTTGGTFSATGGLTIDPNTGEISLDTPGSYTITYSVAADPSICQVAASSTTPVMIIGPVLIELNGGCQDVYVLNATPVNGSFDPQTATFQWNNASGPIANADGQSLNVPATGTYTVTITVDGCSTESAPFEVTSIACQIQRGISVNNDNFNDTFNLTGFDVKKLAIFNRYGQEVYSRANYVNEWGGKSDSGDELPDGTYFYVIDKNTGGSITGWIYINRAQ